VSRPNGVLSLLTAAAVCSSALGAPTVFRYDKPAGDELTVTVFHTNDLHGHSFRNVLARPGGDVTVGGLFSLATLVEARRKELWHERPDLFRAYVRNRRNDGILVVDAGDCWSGAYDDAVSQGANLTALMNAPSLDYDACTVGNHDTDYGDEAFLRNLAARNFPVLVANLAEDSELPGTKPYLVDDTLGVRIALFGLAHAETTNLPGGARLRSPIVTCRNLVPELRRQADIVVCIGHLGLDREPSWAKGLAALDDGHPERNIDLIIDAHSHTSRSAALDEDTVVVQAACNGMEAGEVRLLWSPSRRRLTAVTAQRHRLTVDAVPPAPRLHRMFAGLIDAITAERDEVLVEGLDGFLARKTAFMAPALQDPAADVLARALYETVDDADVAMLNQSGVRGMVSADSRGRVTRQSLHRVVPFDEAVHTLEVTGSALRHLVDRGLRLKFSWAGLRVAYRERFDPEGGPPERTLVAVDVLARSTGRPEPLDDRRTYRLVCPTFFLDVYVRPRPGTAATTAVTVRDALLAELRRRADRGPSAKHDPPVAVRVP